jgi:4-hydroxybenzoate polyprenyltransferase
LFQVNHQIWLLKNVFWWYLLPIAAALGISFGVSAWHWRQEGIPMATGIILFVLVCALTYGGVYWLNQIAVRKDLEPRRQELETLLSSLN